MTVDPLDFDNKYELIASTKTFSPTKIDPRVCRFCNRGQNATTFDNDAHAFSEFLGANDLISWEECDSCNKEFCKFESHLSKFFQPFVTWNGIIGKNGVPSFQSRSINRDPLSHTMFSFNEPHKYSFIIGTPEDYTIDKMNKTFSIKFRIPTHRPILVYKSLVKIALSLLPPGKVLRYSSIFDWLMDRCINPNIFASAVITTLKGKRFDGSYADLYEARPKDTSEDIVPELTMVLRFGNIITQIFLPMTDEYLSKQQSGKNLGINLSPAHLFDNDLVKVAETGKIDYKFYMFDLSRTDPSTHDLTMDFTYRELKEGDQIVE